jgi:hypothetical protein
VRPGKRFGFTAVEKSDVWRRWKAGQSLHEIGRAFDKPHSCIRCLLLPRGGIPPTTRRRSQLALTLAEREDISRGLATGFPLREIARRLNRSASTVSREIGAHPPEAELRGCNPSGKLASVSIALRLTICCHTGVPATHPRHASAFADHELFSCISAHNEERVRRPNSSCRAVEIRPLSAGGH